ncbi:MAG: acetyl-CoA decarbonylase/synthase complex subunit gamma [Spirochaetota bacterium]
MPLTGMQIYKLLPKTNCKECGFPTCMAFAMQVAAKQKAVTDCPHLSEEAKEELAEASAPPMRLVTIGPEQKQFQLGQETVMFRHEEKFHRPCGIAVKISGDLSDDQANSKVEKINNSVFVRIGEEIHPQLCAVEIDGCEDPAARVKSIDEKSSFPLVVMGKDAGKMKEACQAVQSSRPLVYKADASNIDQFAEIASSANLPLAVAGKNLEELADLTQSAKDKGVEDLLLCFDISSPAQTLRDLTTARRACLKKGFRALGFPTVVEINADSPENETLYGAMFAAKYAGIVIIEGGEPWELLPILAIIQNVYTDPQVPNTVEAKLYEVGNPDEDSPVMFTTNFSLTYFSVQSEVERSKVPAYISVVDTEGLGVLNAYAGDKISAEKIVKTLQQQKVAEKVKHRKLIIPGLVPVFRAEIEDTSEWKEVIIGPESAREIPGFLTSVWKKE